MSITPHDLSECRDLDGLATIIQALNRAAPGPTPLLVGATARDLLMHHTHHIPVIRKTNDVDLAFLLADWAAYHELQDRLLATGEFTRVVMAPHRLRFKQAIDLDLLPFGPLERPDRTIAWPPGEEWILNLVGYREAMCASSTVTLPRGQQVRVPSIPALAVLKLIAWNDRHRTNPLKDAADLELIITKYIETGHAERLFVQAPELLTRDYHWPNCSAWLLGCDAREFLSQTPETESDIVLRQVLQILDQETDAAGKLELAQEMRGSSIQSALDLLAAFAAGFRGAALP